MSLSPQIEALDYVPAPWTPGDSHAVEKLITGGLSMRPDVDLIIGLLHITFRDRFFTDVYRFQGLDTTSIVPDYYAGRRHAPPAEEGDGRQRIQDMLSNLGREDAVAIARLARKLRLGNGGSNSFVVAGTHTESGHTLIASDTHLDTEHPSAYYYMHLETTSEGGDFNAIGATFPGAPFILFGHTESTAWLPTTGFQDASDMYLEALVSGEIREDGERLPTTVMYQGELVEIDRSTEVFIVKEPGAAADTAVSHETDLYYVPHHGPILPTDALGIPLGVKLSIRWTGGGPTSVMRAFFDMGSSSDWESFRSAVDHYSSGGMHWLFADDQSNIGYTGYTVVPVREQLDAANPPVSWLPGDGGYEWVADPNGSHGFESLGRDDIPWVYNPEAGWIVTANNDPGGVMQDNDPMNEGVYLSGMYDLGSRAFQASRRIEQSLEAGRLDFDEVLDMQLDTLSRPAERLLPFLSKAAERRPDLITGRMQQALDLLEAWDYRCDVERVEPTLFHGFMIVFLREMFSDEADGLFGELLLVDTPPPVGQFLLKTAVHFLEATDADIDAIDAGEMIFPSASETNFFDNEGTVVRETRDELLLGSLSSSLDELEVMLANLGANGDDLTTWTWGTAHSLRLDDPAASLVPDASSERYPMNGSLYTFQVGEFDLLHDGKLPERFDALNISSNRFVFEMKPGELRGMAILPGGQDEQPGSPHHNDQLAEFVGETYRTLRFYPDEIAEGLEETWKLPAKFPESGSITVR